MIIECISCKKKFDVDSSLIPDTGRNIQCGSCNFTWFFKNDKLNEINSNILTEDINNFKTQQKTQKENDLDSKRTKKLEKKIISKNNDNKKQKNTFNKILSYLIVFVISFISLIILLDTFKSSLITIFPNLELLLFNLFETLKDIMLFFNDLINN